MPLTNYQESLILKYMFGIASWTQDTMFYVGLSTTHPDNNGQGASEPSGGGYARVAVPTGANFFRYNADNSITNGTVIAFGTSTASWGQIQSVPFFDQAAGGSVRFYGSLSPSQIIGANEVLRFEQNDVRLFL